VPPTFSLLAVSDRASREGVGIAVEDWLGALGAAGIGAVQLREKDLDHRALFELARRAREILPATVRLLVNGRLDIALAAGADGVHLPADGVPAAALRARFAPDRSDGGLLIGRSTHSVAEIERARDEGVDYVTFGPVWETPGKGAPTGIAGLTEAAAVGVPVFALGGVTLERFGDLAAAGAAGVAAIRLFQRTADLPAVARAAREIFGRC
jgi:thiamine-phosphate pyrophosphorylase